VRGRVSDAVSDDLASSSPPHAVQNTSISPKPDLWSPVIEPAFTGAVLDFVKRHSAR
jgi:hypothetical protein